MSKIPADFIKKQAMKATKLYKYLDVNGGLAMLLNCNHKGVCVGLDMPYKPKDKNKEIDWKELRVYHKIGGECFDSVYLGLNIAKDERNKIIEVAKKLNSTIKIY